MFVGKESLYIKSTKNIPSLPAAYDDDEITTDNMNAYLIHPRSHSHPPSTYSSASSMMLRVYNLS